MDWYEDRAIMVREQIEQRGINDQRVLHAMLQVPRHMFVPSGLQPYAYNDRALPIGDGQTISQPYMVALMAQALRLRGDERVLEIGTGSGYAAAVLSLLAAEVYTVERIPGLAQTAAERFAAFGYHNIYVHVDDGTAGLPAYAPFDVISVAAASPWVPRPIREQLSPDGRLVIPVGGQQDQVLLRLTRHNGEETVERLSGVRFVPLLGTHAWNQNDINFDDQESE